MADVELHIDALMPSEMADRAEAVGMRKAAMDFWTMFSLAVLAGAFIAAGAFFSTTVMAGAAQMPYGVTRLLGGLSFCLGLIMVVVAGAELFTGNNLIVMAWAAGKVSSGKLLRNWGIVYLGNFVGSVLTAVIVFASKQYLAGGGAVGLTAVNTANAKTGLEFVQAVALGILCNALVCMAVWLCYSARSTVDKILSIIFPIAAFVAAGFEHSVANMYFIPYGLFLKDFAGDGFWKLKTVVDAGLTPDKLVNLTWANFFVHNLLPVTLGNIIGGAGMVGLVYWFAYLRTKRGMQGAKAPASAGSKLASSKK
ncbi:MAG TPA: formate transporter FocA [Anaerolineae bacterium]